MLTQMDRAVKSSLLWGVVGALSFLVLLQGYHLTAGEFVGLGEMIGVATLVFVASTATTHVVRPRLASRNERP